MAILGSERRLFVRHEMKSGFAASFASVLVRARPPLRAEASYGHGVRTEGKKVLLTTETTSYAAGKQKRSKAVECHYDKVLGIQAGQEEVWDTVLPTVNKAFEGYNVTLFTYGMTGSGKTYTMLGPALMDSSFEGVAPPSSGEIGGDQDRGVVVRVMQHIFKELPKAEVTLSYVQIYQERCYDLLQPAASKHLRVREDPQKKPGQNVNVFVEGLTEVSVNSLEECLEYLIAGFGNVVFRSTKYNEQSSRAHSILTLNVRQKQEKRIVESKVRLVDLAGNERWVMSGPQISPQHARELATINKSLHILGSCLQILSQPPTMRRGQGVVKHVPFRDSTLTLLLRDSLAGNSFTMMICTISCSILYQIQTLSTLRFADRVKRVRMKAFVTDFDPKEQQNQIQAEVEYLRAAVSETPRSDLQELKQKVSQLQKACLGLEGENRQLREQLAELEKQPKTQKAARVRRSNSEPSLPTPDPWFADQDLQDVGYRSHDDLGSRMAGRCLKGHILEAMGSIAQPKVGARAAYFEWHCDRPGCRGSSRVLDLGRFHCSICQHDLCQTCYDQLVGRAPRDLHVHRARPSRPPVETTPRRPVPPRRREAPQKPPYLLRLEESAKALARVARKARPPESIASVSTASTTPESKRKGAQAAERPTSLPPLRAEPRKVPAAPVSARDGLRDAMLLPALTEDFGKPGVKTPGPQLITARRRGPPSVEVVDMRALLGELDAKHAGM